MPGLHAAAEWLLRRWGQADRLAAIDEALQQNRGATPAHTGQSAAWYINGQGQTFVILDAGEFRDGVTGIGSQPSAQ